MEGIRQVREFEPVNRDQVLISHAPHLIEYSRFVGTAILPEGVQVYDTSELGASTEAAGFETIAPHTGVLVATTQAGSLFPATSGLLQSVGGGGGVQVGLFASRHVGVHSGEVSPVRQT